MRQVARFCNRSSAARLAHDVGSQAEEANMILELTKNLYKIGCTLFFAPLKHLVISPRVFKALLQIAAVCMFHFKSEVIVIPNILTNYTLWTP